MARNGNVRVQILNNRLRVYGRQQRAAYTQALQDCMDDLQRTATETAPHDEGILEKSWAKDMKVSPTEVKGVVSFSVRENSSGGNFNYALKMHEGTYKLGDGSKAKPGGTGMSGRHYPVGPNYLGGVARGEAAAYTDHMERAIQSVNENM